MVAPEIAEELASIVLRGRFNPAIFQPAWLAAKGLIRESEANKAELEVVHPEITKFRAGWLTLSVTRERFDAVTFDPAHHAPLRDIVIGIFEILEQTPTSHLGINRAIHFKLHSDAAWHAFGHLLAPKEIWRDILERPGLRSLAIEGFRADGMSDRTLIRLEPSQKFEHSVYVDINSEIRHDNSKGEATPYFVECLRDRFERIQRQALDMAWHLIEKVPEAKR